MHAARNQMLLRELVRRCFNVHMHLCFGTIQYYQYASCWHKPLQQPGDATSTDGLVSCMQCCSPFAGLHIMWAGLSMVWAFRQSKSADQLCWQQLVTSSFIFSDYCAGWYTSAPFSLNTSDISCMPLSIASSSSTLCCCAYSLSSCVMLMEQNLGPHMEQKWAVLAGSWGRVASWKRRAVTGSRDRLNWSYQRNSKRALERASSHS